jgi:hypothetical protein
MSFPDLLYQATLTITKYYRLFIFSIKYFWALDNMTPEEYVKKHLKKPEISNLRGTALG